MLAHPVHYTSDMMTNPVRIAIPCYDGRVFPRFDGANTFCIYSVDLQQGTFNLTERVTCPEGTQVCDWLARLQIQGVICSGIQREYQIQLDRAGIWLNWGVSGPITQALARWLQDHISEGSAVKV